MDATHGATGECPAAAEWIAATISSNGASLSRKPDAPALKASTMPSPSAAAVSMTTPVPGACSRTRAVASIPDMPGMLMSISTTRAGNDRRRSSAAAPLLASATSNPLWLSSVLSPVRNRS